MAKKLPAFAKMVSNDPIRIEIDPDKFYPAIFDELEELYADGDYLWPRTPEMSPDEKQKPIEFKNDEEHIDRYWLEVAYQIAKLDVQAATPFGKKAVRITVVNRPKWALVQYKVGRGEDAATKGKLARLHYQHLRGAIPG